MSKGEKYVLIAKTLAGLEDVLSEELLHLGASGIVRQNRAVRFLGDNELIYRANFFLRTALRILKPLYKFTAGNEEELYRKLLGFDWNNYLSLEHTFAIRALVFSPLFKHSGYVALKVKDAVADHFRSRTGKRPNVDAKTPDLFFYIHIQNKTCSLLIDSSGDSLHKRGYRVHGYQAPLNEVLAAGMVALSGVRESGCLLDPMCGSGTIPIEAALAASGTPPGKFRHRFAFQNWLDYDPDLFRKMKRFKMPVKDTNWEIMGADQSGDAISMVRENIENAGLSGRIRIVRSSFEDLRKPWNQGTIIMNPPYGERMEKERINIFYRTIGDLLKKNYNGYDAWILSSNMEALKSVGLHPSTRIRLFNGPLECKFQKYTLYKGTKKVKRISDN